MLITKEKLSLAKYVERDTRQQSLENLYFDKNKAIACNGHFLIQVEDTPPSQEEFPLIEGMDSTGYVPDKILVSIHTATRVFKNIPTCRKIPVLQNACVETDMEGNIRFGITDLESSMVVRQRKIEGHYPGVNKAIPIDTPQATIIIDIQYLRKVVSALSEFTKRGRVEVSLHGHDGPMICRCEKDAAIMTTVIMPLKENA